MSTDLPYTAHVPDHHPRFLQARFGVQPAHKPGYVSFRVTAKVIETIKGNPLPTIEYFQTHEAPSDGPAGPAATVVISLQRSSDGVLFVLDNGYVFPFSDAVLKAGRARACGRSASPP